MILLAIDVPCTNLAQRLYFEGRLVERSVGPRFARSDRTYPVISRLASIEIVVEKDTRRISVFTGKTCVD